MRLAVWITILCFASSTAFAGLGSSSAYARESSDGISRVLEIAKGRENYSFAIREIDTQGRERETELGKFPIEKLLKAPDAIEDGAAIKQEQMTTLGVTLSSLIGLTVGGVLGWRGGGGFAAIGAGVGAVSGWALGSKVAAGAGRRSARLARGRATTMQEVVRKFQMAPAGTSMSIEISAEQAEVILEAFGTL